MTAANTQPGHARSGFVMDLLALSLLCVFMYFTGLSAQGLSNWQESQRAVVVREMQDPGNPYNPGHVNWLVPTVNGQPYLAKPPMFYWVQLAIAELCGHRAGIIDLRAAAALAGLLGVLATYIVTRRVLEDEGEAGEGTAGFRSRGCLGRSAARWSAVTLATGLLYVHSSRVGELDILMVPFVVAAIGGIAEAWRASRAGERTHWFGVVLAALAAAGAVLTKGPPSLLAIAAGGYGGIALWAAYAVEHGPEDRLAARTPLRVRARITLVLAAGTAGFAAAAVRNTYGPGGWMGCLIIALLCGWLADLALRLATPARFRVFLRTLSRTHPLIVLGVPLLALWWWYGAVAARIGADAASAWTRKETEDNLNIFIAVSPWTNLGVALYGVGLASFGAIGTLAWLVRTRPRLPAAWYTPLAWTGLGFAGFSLLGKGVGRYLTPLWPGIAMLAGLGIATLLARTRPPRRIRPALLACVAALAIGQAWWYAIGREHALSRRSPRDMVRELLDGGVAPGRLASFEFSTPALTYYAGERVEPVGFIFIRDVTVGGKPWSLDDLAADVRARGPIVLLVRSRQTGDPAWSSEPAIDRLRAAGFVVEPIPTRSRFVIDNGRIDVLAVRVSLRATS